MKNLKGLLYGFAIGDAMGVPYEFLTKEEISNQGISDTYISGGFHDQPKGTWSDDTSLTLAFLDTYIKTNRSITAFNLILLAFYQGRFSINDNLFDIGITTEATINNLVLNTDISKQYGYSLIHSNGNGSLMRILPLVEITKGMSLKETYKTIEFDSKFTHGHLLSIASCFILVQFMKKYNGDDVLGVFKGAIQDFYVLFPNTTNVDFGTTLFSNVLKHGIDLNKESIYYQSSGSVHGTLYCVMTILQDSKNNFKEAIRMGIESGGDTDTICAIVGGIIGYLKGYESLPSDLIDGLLGKELINKTLGNYDN